MLILILKKNLRMSMTMRMNHDFPAAPEFHFH